MTVNDIMQHASQTLCTHEGLFLKNVELLKEFGITDFKSCKSGAGASVFGETRLEEKIKTIIEMGKDDEILSSGENALEGIRACTITLNYNQFKQKEDSNSYKRSA